MTEHTMVRTHETFGLETAPGAVEEDPGAESFHHQHGGEESNDHLASIYEGEADQFATVVPFVREGLAQGERCLYVADENTETEVEEALRDGGVDVDAALDSGALSIHTKADTYLRTGEFEQEAMLDFWQETLEEARDEGGFSGLRAAAEMTWALEDGLDLDRLVRYEAMLNTIYPGEDYVVLCQYNRERFPTEVISDVIRSHPQVVYDGTVCQNFYYHSPEEFFGADRASMDVDRMVAGLVSRARTRAALEARDRQLHTRVRQQEVEAELGKRALEERNVDGLLADVTGRVADTLDADYCKVLELLPGGDELLLKEGAGWHDGVVGNATVGTERDSQAGFTLLSEEPVIVEDLAAESRFSGPDLLVDHDVTSGISVVIGTVDKPWGVLGVHARDRRDFSDRDVAFVQSVANTLASAIERIELERYQRELYAITSDSDRSFEEKLDALFDLGCEFFDLELGGTARVDPATELFVVETTSDDHEHLVPGARAALSETYCRLVADGDETTVGVSDPVGRGFEGTRSYEEFGVRAYLGTRIEVEGDLDRTLFFVSSEPREGRFSDAERTFQHLMGQWIESELEQRQREDQLAALNTLSRELMQAEEQAAVCAYVVEAAETTLGLAGTAIALNDRRGGDLQVAAATDDAAELLETSSILGPGGSVGWNVLVEDEPQRVQYPLEETEYPPEETATSTHPSFSEVAVFPLGSHGVFVTGSPAPGGFSASTYDLAETVAANTEAALDRARRERLLQEREERLVEQNEALERLNRINDTIRGIDRVLVSASTRSEVEEVVCEQLVEAGPYELAWIGEHNSTTDAVVPREWAGAGEEYIEDQTGNGSGASEERCPASQAIETREAQVVDDLLEDSRYEPWRQAALHHGFQAAIALPLVYDETLYGVLAVYADRPEVFDDLERSVLAELSETIAYAINAVESKKALVSDEVTELEFEIRDDGHPLVRLTEEIGGTVTLESLVPRMDGRLRAFISTRGIPEESVIDAHDADVATDISQVAEYDDDGESKCVFEVTVADGSLSKTALERGGVVRKIVANGGSARVDIELAADANIHEFIETIQTKYPATELTAQRSRVRSPETQHGFNERLLDDLTDRQLEVLQTAYFSGYFERPRTRNGSEVAATMGITQPTFNSHLRAAHRKLCRIILEDDSPHGSVG